MKILVPIDGSTYSDNSLAFVASRTSLLGQNPQIELLVVLDPLPARAARLVGKDSLKRYYEEEADKIFAPARKFLKKHSIAATESFLLGNPAEKIAEEAGRMDADLIVMGSRGRTAMAGLFLGSVTNGVLARTKHPILIVRDKNPPESDGMRVGVCVDGSKFGSAAVKYAIRNPELFGEGAKFYIINVTSDYAGAIMPDMAGMALPALSEAEVVELQKNEFEEERRLFYVGMTRAKNELHIFKLADTGSCFIKEMRVIQPNQARVKGLISDTYKKPARQVKEMTLASDFELIIGERVVQKKYGAGVVSDVLYDENGKASRFTVTFDSREERIFAFPIAFSNGMRLESRE